MKNLFVLSVLTLSINAQAWKAKITVVEPLGEEKEYVFQEKVDVKYFPIETKLNDIRCLGKFKNDKQPVLVVICNITDAKGKLNYTAVSMSVCNANHISFLKIEDNKSKNKPSFTIQAECTKE